MADEVGCQPAGSGGETLRHSTYRSGQPGGACPIEANERTIACLLQKFFVNQRLKHGLADVPVESPKSLSLGGGQPKARHLQELSLNSPKDIVDTHALVPEVAGR